MSFHPQTPQSPSQYSPGNSNTTTDMTSSMTMTNNSSGMTPTLPTPAHSVNGSSLPSEMALDGGSLLSAGADDMTGHHKRKRAIHDIGGSDREQKKVQIEDRRLGIENLHLDVGAKYLLCKTPHTTSSVYCSEDLFEKFGLTGLAAEVARVLPNGEKNAIRKTYKGHIKKLGVSGHFDSVKEEWNRPDGMISLLKYPQEEWMVQQVRGKEVENGLSRETLARMDKAFSFAKGVVPKSTWDSSVLGDLAPGALGKAEKQSASARPTAPNTPVPSAAPGVVPRLKQTSLAPDAARPRRSIKKRSYGDSSFEGYGDGFPDDDMGPGSGYSTGEGEMGAAAQKRRKKNPTGGQTPSYSQVRQPSYGPGMVGA